VCGKVNLLRSRTRLEQGLASAAAHSAAVLDAPAQVPQIELQLDLERFLSSVQNVPGLGNLTSHVAQPSHRAQQSHAAATCANQRHVSATGASESHVAVTSAQHSHVATASPTARDSKSSRAEEGGGERGGEEAGEPGRGAASADRGVGGPPGQQIGKKRAGGGLLTKGRCSRGKKEKEKDVFDFDTSGGDENAMDDLESSVSEPAVQSARGREFALSAAGGKVEWGGVEGDDAMGGAEGGGKREEEREEERKEESKEEKTANREQQKRGGVRGGVEGDDGMSKCVFKFGKSKDTHVSACGVVVCDKINPVGGLVVLQPSGIFVVGDAHDSSIRLFHPLVSGAYEECGHIRVQDLPGV